MNLWNYFDKIYCINLEKDIEKKKNVENICKKLDIPITFFKAIKDDISDKGCLLSHREIYNLALKNGYEKILIFEDDIIPSRYKQDDLKNCIDFMKEYSWDIFYFGSVPSIFSYCQKKIKKIKNIYSIRGICTHAYALNKNALSILKDIEWSPNSPLDYIIRSNPILKSYAVYPSFFYQDTGYKLPKGVITLGLRVNEFYGYHIGIPLKYIIGIVIIFIVCFFLIKKIITK